ncbi:MAG: CapA family protein [Planctomycetota bacterium]
MSASDMITFGAVGDIAFRGETDKQVSLHGAGWPFEKMLPHLHRADLLFGNMESVAIPPDFPENQIDPAGLISRLPAEEIAAAIRRAEFDFMNLAANHVLDAGRLGMDYTKKTLEDAGLVTGGVGYSQAEARALKVIERGGIAFGFLCYGEDSNYTLGHTSPSYAYYEREAVVEDVRKHKGEVDVLVVSIHADLEFMPTPSVPRMRNSRAIAEAGAKIILQHHPHVPQGIEFMHGCLIAYSLGNFVFQAHTSEYMKNNGPHTAHSFLLLAEVGKDGVRSFERVPFEIPPPPEERPTPLDGDARKEMLRYLDELDTMLKDEEIVRRTWRDIAKRRLAGMLKKCAGMEINDVIEEMVGRLALTAENRSWMEEVLAMGREAWARQQAESDPYHRPHYRFTKPKE